MIGRLKDKVPAAWRKRLILIAVVGFTAALTHVLSAPPLPQTLAQQRKRLLGLFDHGALGFQQGRQILEVCPETDGHMWIFCREGYFYRRALAGLKNSGHPLSEILSQQVNELREASIAVAGTWGIAFGIAYGRSGADITAARQAFAAYPELLFKYFIDGWALAEAERNGGRATLSECREKLGEETVEICAWGVGRSVFFGLPADRREIIANPQVRAGFDFAKAFTFPRVPTVEEIGLTDRLPTKLAEITKRLTIEPNRRDPSLWRHYLCFQSRHFSECD